MNKKAIEALAKALKLDVKELTQAIETEDAEFSVPEGRFLTPEQEGQLLDNHGERKYIEGAKAAKEMQLKEMSDKLGFEERVKDPEKLLEAYKKKILEEAKAEPNDKIKTLEESLETLRAKIGEKNTEIETLKNDYSKKVDKLEIQSYFTGVPEDKGITPEEAASLFLMKHETKEDGIYLDGKILQDDMAKPLTKKAAVEKFISDRGWNAEDFKGNAGKSGDSTKTKTTFSSYEEWEQHAEEKYGSVSNVNAQSELKAIVDKDPSFLD